MHLCVNYYVISGHKNTKSKYDNWMKEWMKEWTKTSSIPIHKNCLVSSKGKAT